MFSGGECHSLSILQAFHYQTCMYCIMILLLGHSFIEGFLKFYVL